MDRQDEKLLHAKLTRSIIACAFEVINELGSGFLESEARQGPLSGEAGWRQTILFILSIHVNQGSTHARRRNQTPHRGFGHSPLQSELWRQRIHGLTHRVLSPPSGSRLRRAPSMGRRPRLKAGAARTGAPGCASNIHSPIRGRKCAEAHSPIIACAFEADRAWGGFWPQSPSGPLASALATNNPVYPVHPCKSGILMLDAETKRRIGVLGTTLQFGAAELRAVAAFAAQHCAELPWAYAHG